MPLVLFSLQAEESWKLCFHLRACSEVFGISTLQYRSFFPKITCAELQKFFVLFQRLLADSQ